MKKNKYFKLVVLLFFTALLNNTLSAQSIFDIVPAGGECFEDNSSCTISWINSDTNNVDIYLWNGNTCSWDTIATSVASNTYSWNINVNNFGDRFRIKIQNSSDNKDYFFSTAYFSIVESQQQFNDIKDKLLEESGILKLFPNPAKNFVNIELRNHLIRTIYLWNLNGNVLYHRMNINSQRFKIHISELNNGQYYIVCISASGKRYVKKLIINR